MSFPLDALSGYPVRILSNTNRAVIIEVDLAGRDFPRMVLQILDRCPGTRMADHGSSFQLTNPAFAATLSIPLRKGGPAIVHAYDDQLVGTSRDQTLSPSTKRLAEAVGGYVHVRTGSALFGLGVAFAVMVAKEYVDGLWAPTGRREESAQRSRRLP